MRPATWPRCPNLAEIASTAPSHNIQLVSIFHDLAQAQNAATGSRPRRW